MAHKLTLILGGARSGKSQYATSLAQASELPITYVASGSPSDPEMKRRVEEHRKARPESWSTVEAGGRVIQALREADQKGGLIILDCLTMFVGELVESCKIADSNLVNEKTEQEASQQVEEFLSIISELSSPVIVVSNEVGMGVVPSYPSGRLFRDLAGYANKKLAEQADEVIMLTAGIPTRLKTED